ncbi:hypothetical protein GCM10010123_32230 [Pilimelia anulata]|uniref:Uncharacterized protein n=1 Tax=Pilimelia anulata TaxID=53371 RepID=A0A8J3BDA9_9ACTN|nr:hypothetical protein GCM10010123_32230 [Pilimelia anulata]
MDRTTVARWEIGATDPQPWARPRLAAALAVGLDELARLLDPASAAGSQRHPAGERPVPAADGAAFAAAMQSFRIADRQVGGATCTRR